MIQELSPATRQRIIDTAHRDGHYKATHGSLKMEIDVYQIPNSVKQGVTLKVCIDRKWTMFAAPSVFEAVEQFNRVLREKQYKARQESLLEEAHDPGWLTD